MGMRRKRSREFLHTHSFWYRETDLAHILQFHTYHIVGNPLGSIYFLQPHIFVLIHIHIEVLVCRHSHVSFIKRGRDGELLVLGPTTFEHHIPHFVLIAVHSQQTRQKLLSVILRSCVVCRQDHGFHISFPRRIQSALHGIIAILLYGKCTIVFHR